MPLDTPLSVTDRLFFSELDRTGSERILRGALAGAVAAHPPESPAARIVA